MNGLKPTMIEGALKREREREREYHWKPSIPHLYIIDNFVGHGRKQV